MSHLRQTQLLRTHVSSDINLLAELTLYGKFYELPHRLFFRRFHKESGSWKRGDPDRDPNHDAKRYHAAGAGKFAFQEWRSQLGFVSAVNRSPLPLASRVRIYRHLLRRMIWNRRSLMGELLRYVGLSPR